MKVSEVLAQKNYLIKNRVEIEGFLVVIGKVSHISPDRDYCENFHKSILIRYENFRDLLRYYKVPPYVGGFLYQDFITITGTLCESDLEPFTIALTNITSLILTREENVYQIEVTKE